jgi:hypothetical protein
MGLAQAGGTRYSNLAVVETKVVVAAGPVLLFNIMAFNTGGAVSYLQFFDALTADVTVGTTTPTFVIPLPASGGVSDAYVLPERFRTGVVLACTDGSSNNSAPGGAAVVKLGYVGG